MICKILIGSHNKLNRLPKRYPVVIDETVELCPSVGISAGMRGVEIVLSPGDLLQITYAETADIARSS